MFDNIIGHGETVRSLQQDLSESRFPRAVLFFGPPFEGKLSAALEAARVLTCREGSGDWACDCSACVSQRGIAHPYTVLLGPRYFDVEIASCADALRRTRIPAGQYLFLRAVRKLFRRCDADFWDGEEAKLAAVQSKIEEIAQIMAPVEPGRELPAERELDLLLAKAVEACSKLAASLKIEHVSVAQVRALSSWSSMTAPSARIVILENADRMQDSARNALLKILEEPPSGTYFFLLTSRRAALPATILSRLRPYPFLPRPPQEQRDVITRIFRAESSEAATLREFFLSWKEINPQELRRFASRFIECVHDPADPVEVLREADGFWKQGAARESFLSFLDELAALFHEALRRYSVPIATLECWSALVRECRLWIESYNLSPQTAMESLYRRMRECAGGGA
jgi:DNA polymerase III delta prime subunit